MPGWWVGRLPPVSPASRHSRVLWRGWSRRWGGSAGRRPRVVVASLRPVVALAVAFPESGYQPFALGTLWPLLAAGVFVLLLRPGRVIGTATTLYLLGCIAAYPIHTPVAGNAARVGDLIAGPAVALLLVPRRAWLLLALAAVPLTYLQVHDA